MNTVIFNSGQEVEPRDLMTSQLYLQNEIKDRSLDFISPGILGTKKQYVYIDVNNTLRFEPFRALNINGEVMQLVKAVSKLALHLGSGDWRLTTRGVLPLDEWGFTPGTSYYICAKYITKYTRPRAHVVSQQGRATRLSSGIELYAFPSDSYLVENGVRPYVILGKYNVKDEDQQSTLDIDNVAEYATMDPTKMLHGGPTANRTSIYNPTNLAVSFAEHIMALGSAVPTPDNPHGMDLTVQSQNLVRHETYLHSPGFIGDIHSTDSLGYMIPNVVTGGQDNLKIFNINKTADNINQFIMNNGTWLSSFAFTAPEAFIHLLDYNSSGTIVYADDGIYKFGVDYTTGNIIATHIGNTSDNSLSALPITESSDINTERIGTVILYSESDYNNKSKLDLCSFEFKQTGDGGIKPISYITPDTPRSNFITKTDLRTVGSISTEMLQATKEGEDTVVSFPDIIEVSKVKFRDTNTVLDGYVGLPSGYLNGFDVKCLGEGPTMYVAVGSGTCKDNTNTYDINSQSTISKYLFKNWEAGGTATNIVGGLTSVLGTTDTTIHVFIISTQDGLVDVALDTVESGNHVKETLPEYKYVRRIASFYLTYDEDSHIHTAVTSDSYLEGQTLVTQYMDPVQITYDSTNHTLYTQVPTSTTTKYVAKITYKYTDAANAAFIYELTPNDTSPRTNIHYISGCGVIEVPLNNGKIGVGLPLGQTAVPTFYLLGYRDTRNG